MENIILRKLEEEKNKYFKKNSVIGNSNFTDDDTIFYENIMNHLILYKLMKNYSSVPDMIIDFIENLKIVDSKYIYKSILDNIQSEYLEKEYGKFIPSKEMLDAIIKYTRDEKVCILGDDYNFLIYLLKNKGINNVFKYKKIYNLMF